MLEKKLLIIIHVWLTRVIHFIILFMDLILMTDPEPDPASDPDPALFFGFS
jgi:hypothetical protein